MTVSPDDPDCEEMEEIESSSAMDSEAIEYENLSLLVLRLLGATMEASASTTEAESEESFSAFSKLIEDSSLLPADVLLKQQQQQANFII